MVMSHSLLRGRDHGQHVDAIGHKPPHHLRHEAVARFHYDEALVPAERAWGHQPADHLPRLSLVSCEHPYGGDLRVQVRDGSLNDQVAAAHDGRAITYELHFMQ